MFVITADQRDSRTSDDLVPVALAAVSRIAHGRLSAAPERTAGDEIQLATADPQVALALILELTRTGTWSVGVGVGAAEQPLPASVRAGRGDAFIFARAAVERAKKTPTRLAVDGGADATDAESLIRLLLEMRDRRSDEGWEVHDLLADGLTQREVAARLGITPAAVSLRAKAAGLRTEEAALPALERLLGRADAGA